MVMMAESEMNSKESAEQQGNHSNKKNHSVSSLGRQSSIYSLTLDEFQHTVCENNGKNFGSMNMDEFLSSIWSAEENQGTTETSTIIRKQQQQKQQQNLLPRQQIPSPLSRKTVDEVWSEIHKGQQSQSQQQHNNVNTDSVPRQPTFGEMTLEDFLVKAGVVREPSTAYGMFPNNNKVVTLGPSFRPVMGIGDRGNVVARPPYGGAIGFHAHPAYGGRVVSNGGGGVGYGIDIGMATGHPASPVSPDQMGMGAGENCGVQYGMEMGLLRGRKRGLDGSHVEKVVERRQKRMIKNRESAARSRARKQAYTIELEAELNQLKEENSQLKLALVEFERRRKQKCLEEENERIHVNDQQVKRKLGSLRRTLSF